MPDVWAVCGRADPLASVKVNLHDVLELVEDVRREGSRHPDLLYLDLIDE